MNSLPTFVGSRIAPAYFALGNLRGQNLRRGLVWAVVPRPADKTGVASAFLHCGRELVKGVNNDQNGGVVLRGEPHGIALHSVAAGLNFETSVLPGAVPFSCFGFVCNHLPTAGAIQTFIHCGGTGSQSWSFQFDYSAGQLGLTRWGIADNPTTTLGAVPSAGAESCIGLSHNGTTARFFLNGRFENVASGSVNAPTGTPFNQLAHRQGGAGLRNCAIYVAYAWNRVVTDGEFFQLMQDPWILVRPPELPWIDAVAGGGGGGARIFVPAFIG